MKKIFQLISSVQLGGAEIIAFCLSEHSDQILSQPAEISVIELYRSKNSYADQKRKELAQKTVPVITLHNGSKRVSLLISPIKLCLLILKEKPSIIHSHTDLPDFVLAVALKMLSLFSVKKPEVIRTIHSTQLWRTHHTFGRISESAYQDEPVAAVSSYAMTAYEQLRKKYNLPISQNRQIIYNSCKVPSQNPHSFHIDTQKINIAFCGRFEDYKGMDTLLEIIPEISLSYPGDFLFHLIGDGTYKKKLQQLALQQDNVILYEPVPNVSTMFHAFDFLFMPSHFEGLTLISIEASFAGVPVIASFAPGLDETLPENWPLKFHLDRKDELLAIFRNIKDQLYNLKKIREMAFDFVSKKFSMNEMIQSYHQLYTEIL